MWQFKISHGAKGGAEDQVIQFGVTGSGAGQTVTLYGPAEAEQVATSNTFVAPTGSFTYNTPTQFTNGIKVFAGERADPFFFDLFGFFTFLGDRHYALHNAETDPGPAGVGPGNALSNGDNVGAAAKFAPGFDKTANPGTPSFNGFKAGTMSGTGGYACSTNPSMNALADIGGGFNVLSYVVEVPRALLTTGYSSSAINVWATVNSSTGSYGDNAHEDIHHRSRGTRHARPRPCRVNGNNTSLPVIGNGNGGWPRRCRRTQPRRAG